LLLLLLLLRRATSQTSTLWGARRARCACALRARNKKKQNKKKKKIKHYLMRLRGPLLRALSCGFKGGGSLGNPGDASGGSQRPPTWSLIWAPFKNSREGFPVKVHKRGPLPGGILIWVPKILLKGGLKFPYS